MLWELKPGRCPSARRPALSEVGLCNGGSNCTIKTNSNGKQGCSFCAKWVIPQDDLGWAYVFSSGTHGNHFKVNNQQLPLGWATQQAIVELDGLDYGCGGATTATNAMLQAQQCLWQAGLTSWDVCPPP